MQKMISGFNDHAKFCEHLRIRNKDGLAVPYRHSPAGRKLNQTIRKQEEAGQPVRVVALKASQVWMSSSAATEIFRRVPFFPGRRALVVADIQAHADLVFEYYLQYIKSYTDNPYGAEWDSSILLPKLVKDTEQWLRWANDSSILVGTANNVDIGRSAPYNWAHLSEAAFYRDMGGLMTGLMQRIPNSPDSGVIVESTANGMGGDFYDLCQRAMDPRRNTGWAFVFFAWWEHPEYQCNPKELGYADMPAFQKTLNQAEIQERNQYRLIPEQLAWRRRQIETACEGKIERFRQEFPANPQEAFQASGRTIFDMAAVGRMPVIQDGARGKLEVVDVGMEKRVQFAQSADRRGELVVYRMPRRGGHYIIGADHAEGIDPTAKSGSSDPDYSSATVYDADTGEQVAAMKERYEPIPWAERLYWLGRYYQWAFLVPEQKAVGKAVIGQLLNLQYPLELIYATQRDPSDRRPAQLQELGFNTSTTTRDVLIGKLDAAMREGAIQLHDPETIQELREFVRKPNGRAEGQKHDDCVISCALGVEGFAYAHRAFKYRDSIQTQGQQQWKASKYGRQDDD
jgi:hypothetical protein